MLLVDGAPTQDINALKDYERHFVVLIRDGKIFKNTPSRAGLPRRAAPARRPLARITGSTRQDYVRRTQQRASEARPAGSRAAAWFCASSRMIDSGACANDKLTPPPLHFARGGFQVSTAWA